MAKVTYEDLVDGNSGVLTLRKGWEFTRIAVVAGLTGDGHSRIKAAVEAPGMVKIGDPHPDVESVIAKQISCASEASDIVRLAIKYSAPDLFISAPDQVVITGGSTLGQTETNTDINGDVMFTEYTYPDPYPETPDLAGDYAKHGAMVPLLIPQSTENITRIENKNPRQLASIYVGKINSIKFLDGLPHTYMCTNIDYNSQDGGLTYTVTYSFQFRPDGWSQQLVFQSSDTGDPPAFDTPEELALGVKNYDIYEQIDFKTLGLE